jgi:hypothetical protein
VYAGEGQTLSFSYDYLINDLGLSLGLHEIKLQTSFIHGDDFDFTTIEIVPEPATLLLLGLGCLMFERKHKKVR